MTKYCGNCKHIAAIISQSGNYYCYKIDEYFDSLPSKICDDYLKDDIPLSVKERVWD